MAVATISIAFGFGQDTDGVSDFEVGFECDSQSIVACHVLQTTPSYELTHPVVLGWICHWSSTRSLRIDESVIGNVETVVELSLPC